jgi:pimeloyl-ACP methyl ester carboxylesterase
MPDKAHPVVFIHGLWLHPSSWAAWESVFGQAGYRVLSPGWPGDQETVDLARANPDSVADHGIDDVVEHFASIIGDLDASPVLIGHSFGGMIAEKLLGQDRAAVAIAIDAAQISGTDHRCPAVAAIFPAVDAPGLQEPREPASRRHAHRRAVPLQLRERAGRGRIGRALQKVGGASARQAALRGGGGQFHAALADRGGHAEPAARAAAAYHGRSRSHGARRITNSTLKQYRYSPAATELLEFADRGHSLTIDAGWGEVAGACLSWLADKGFLCSTSAI